MNAPHNNTETSQEAAESIQDLLGGLRKTVHQVLKDCPLGLTCDEIEQRLDLRHQTASARLNELQRLGLAIVHIDPKTNKPLTRPTRSGRNARIYFPNK
jgi:hypothetical protein